MLNQTEQNMHRFKGGKLVTIYGQRHAKRDIWTYAKSVDPDQPQRLRRRVWSGSALFDTPHINKTYISCCMNSLITYKCFKGWSWSTLCEMSEGPFSRDAGHYISLRWHRFNFDSLCQLNWLSAVSGIHVRTIMTVPCHRIICARNK